MEGLGARLGRSSSRYGTTAVFSGPVRKWKKDWVPIPAPSSSNNNNNYHHHHHHNNNYHHHHHPNGGLNAGSNGSSNGSVSHLRLFKWTPLNKENSDNSNDNNSNTNISSNDSGVAVAANGSKDNVVSEEPPRRKFKYIPIAVLEEQKKEAEENTDDDEAKTVESDENAGEQAFKGDDNDEKPNINDVPMQENQAVEENQTAPERQDLNELDLSLGLTSHDQDHDSDPKTAPKTDVQL